MRQMKKGTHNQTGDGVADASEASSRPSKRAIVHRFAFAIVLFLVALKVFNFVFPFSLGIYFPDWVRAFCAGWWPAYSFLIAIYLWGFTRP